MGEDSQNVASAMLFWQVTTVCDHQLVVLRSFFDKFEKQDETKAEFQTLIKKHNATYN